LAKTGSFEILFNNVVDGVDLYLNVKNKVIKGKFFKNMFKQIYVI